MGGDRSGWARTGDRRRSLPVVRLLVVSFSLMFIALLSPISNPEGTPVRLALSPPGAGLSGWDAAGGMFAPTPPFVSVPGDASPPRWVKAFGTAGAQGKLPAGAQGPYGLASTAGLTVSGIPSRAYLAYTTAAAVMTRQDPRCRVHWSLLAGIGRVESNHGRYGGAGIAVDGRVSPPILGIRLDGSRPGTARISDSDGGRFDGDRAFDRAVGPMQFLPGTWAIYGGDGDADRVRNPQDLDDAALGAAQYLCAGPGDLSTRTGRWSAVFRYNHSDSYVSLVLSLADTYASGRVGRFPEPPAVRNPMTGIPSVDGPATPPGRPPAIDEPDPPAKPKPKPSPSPTPKPTPGTPTPTPTTPTPTPTTPTPTPTTPSPTTPPPDPTTPPPDPTTPPPDPTTPPASTEPPDPPPTSTEPDPPASTTEPDPPASTTEPDPPDPPASSTQSESSGASDTSSTKADPTPSATSSG